MIRKSVGGFKYKIVTIFKINTPKQPVYGQRKKLSKPKKTQKQTEEDYYYYYKPKRISNFWNRDFIAYERNDDRNKNLSQLYQKSDTSKIQLTIAINFISSKDSEEERVMHSKSDSIIFTSYNDANKVFDENFKSLSLRYQDNL